MCRDEHVDRSTVPSRRTVLAGVGLATLGTLAGCLGTDEAAPDPIALEEGQFCDVCDMEIAMHPGPVGQAYYADEEALPPGRDGPAWFCSGQCLYTYVLEQSNAGYDPAGAYATDYSTVDWELRTDDGTTVISAHLQADAFELVESLEYVVASDVEGAMGKSLIGFTDADDVDAFVADHGGERYQHGDVSRQLIDSLDM